MSSRLQRLIEWPLWSWKHLAITVVFLLAVLALVGKATNALSAEATAAPASLPVASSAPPWTSSPTSSSSIAKAIPTPQASHSSTDVAPVGASCEDVVTSFMRAWVRTNVPAGEWLSAMRPFASAALITELSRTDPARVPASRVTGRPVAVVTAGGHAFRFATDGGRVDASTQKRGSSCVVSDIEPAGDVQGAPTPSLTPSVAAG